MLSLRRPSCLVLALLACGPSHPDDPDDKADPSDSESDSDGTTTGDSAGDGPAPATTEFCAPLPPQTPVGGDVNGRCDVDGEWKPCETAAGPGRSFCESEEWGPCLATWECEPGEYLVCWHCDPMFGTGVAYCQLEDGIPLIPDEACATPLVLVFDARPVTYHTDVREFPMSRADDGCATDWPTAATPWLALDRDRSGSIDGGWELFGSGTPVGGLQRPRDGFLPLAELDTDRDGRLTARDARFAELVVWRDHDGDRRSSLWELEPLHVLGVRELSLTYHTEPGRCDAHGNCELERAAFTHADPSGALHHGEVVDIRLACR